MKSVDVQNQNILYILRGPGALPTKYLTSIEKMMLFKCVIYFSNRNEDNEDQLRTFETKQQHIALLSYDVLGFFEQP
jgi:hypothetical protein